MDENTGVTNNIGIVVPNLADPFFAAITRNDEPRVVEAGFRFDISDLLLLEDQQTEPRGLCQRPRDGGDCRGRGRDGRTGG